MMSIKYLSEHQLSQKWLSQFQDSRDRALATQLLDQLKLVSERTFESAIEDTLKHLQNKLNAKIAVYPISSPESEKIIGYKPFYGATSGTDECDSKSYRTGVGRRQHFGSEHKLGHVLRKIQDQLKQNNGCSVIECSPTLKQLSSQGIQHIVLVDDICGSGRRIIDFWKNAVPKSIKSLLSLKKMTLWIVLYAISPTGKKYLQKQLPNFPMENLITVLPENEFNQILPYEVSALCLQYAHKMGIDSSALGYKDSASLIVFEHGCPNNTPIILWKNFKRWKALFPNNAIPNDFRDYFDGNNAARMTEVLWQANQSQLALNLLEKMKQKDALNADENVLLTFLGLKVRGFSRSKIQAYLLLSLQQFSNTVKLAKDMGLYTEDDQISELGKAFLNYFRDKYSHTTNENDSRVEKTPESYYPLQCEGKLRQLGKKN